MRRLPPNKVEQNLNGLLNLIPEETEELLQRVDQPLKEATDPETVSLFMENLKPTFLFYFTSNRRDESTYSATTTAMETLTGM